MYILLLLACVIISVGFIYKLVSTKNYLFSIWLLYIFIELIFGILSKELISKYIKWRIEFDNQFLWIYLISISTMFIAFKLSRRKKNPNGFKILEYPLNKVLIFLFIPFVFISYKILSFNSSFNSIDSRTEIVTSISGTEFILYKFGFIILALIAVVKSKKYLHWVLAIIVLFSFSLYGGRFLLFSGILIYALIFFHAKINFNSIFKLKALISILVLYISVSTFVANTRYYMSNNDSFAETFTIEKYSSTLYMQLGGNWLDFSRVMNSSQNIDLARHFFPTMLEGFLPSGIREYFFPDFFENKLSYGKYFAEAIYENNNALRMNFINEIFFSFGYIGVIVYSILLGYLFKYFTPMLNSFNYSIAYFFLIQLIALHILGINTFSNALILTLLYMYIFKKITIPTP